MQLPSKQAARQEALKARDKSAGQQGRTAGSALASIVLTQIPLRPAETVGGYWPVRSEINPLPAMIGLALLGHRLALPVVEGPDRPLAFRLWRPGDPLEAGPYNIPAPGLSAPLVTPSLVLVPGLRFDRQGGRLGYGGGFYDRTLASLRRGWQPTCVGLTYESGLGDLLDLEAHDTGVEFIATERRALRASSPGS